MDQSGAANRHRLPGPSGHLANCLWFAARRLQDPEMDYRGTGGGSLDEQRLPNYMRLVPKAR
jgi:hypothetical protein